jgi:hypothetical protein
MAFLNNQRVSIPNPLTLSKPGSPGSPGVAARLLGWDQQPLEIHSPLAPELQAALEQLEAPHVEKGAVVMVDGDEKWMLKGC